MQEKLLTSKVFKWVYWGISITSLFLSRWLLKSTYLYHWDSIQFALSLEKFDLIKHQPHPPGYIVYVFFARIINSIVDNPNIALITVGIIFSVLGLILIVKLAKDIFGNAVGYLAGLLYVVNPAIWFHGLVAEVYIVEAVWVLLVLYLAYKYLNNKNTRNLIILGIFLGLLGGVRQVAEVLILPLVIYVVFFTKGFTWKSGKIFLISLVIANLAWIAPLVYLTGGILEYINILTAIVNVTIWQSYSVLKMNLLIENLSLFWQTIKNALSIQIPILMLAIIPFIAIESRNRYKISKENMWFFIMAIIPGVVILPLLIITNPGYTLYLVPIFLILSAWGIVFIGDVVKKWHRKFGGVVLWSIIIIVSTASVLSFYNTKTMDFKYASASLASVKEVDKETEKFITSVRKEFDPKTDIVFINQGSIFQGVRHLQYYLPEFDLYAYSSLAMIHDPENIIWHVKGKEVFEFIKQIDISPTTQKIMILANEINLNSLRYLVANDLNGAQSVKYFDLYDEDTLNYLDKDMRFNFK